MSYQVCEDYIRGHVECRVDAFGKQRFKEVTALELDNLQHKLKNKLKKKRSVRYMDLMCSMEELKLILVQVIPRYIKNTETQEYVIRISRNLKHKSVLIPSRWFDHYPEYVNVGLKFLHSNVIYIEIHNFRNQHDHLFRGCEL